MFGRCSLASFDLCHNLNQEARQQILEHRRQCKACQQDWWIIPGILMNFKCVGLEKDFISTYSSESPVYALICRIPCRCLHRHPLCQLRGLFPHIIVNTVPCKSGDLGECKWHSRTNRLKPAQTAQHKKPESLNQAMHGNALSCSINKIHQYVNNIVILDLWLSHAESHLGPCDSGPSQSRSQNHNWLQLACGRCGGGNFLVFPCISKQWTSPILEVGPLDLRYVESTLEALTVQRSKAWLWAQVQQNETIEKTWENRGAKM